MFLLTVSHLIVSCLANIVFILSFLTLLYIILSFLLLSILSREQEDVGVDPDLEPRHPNRNPPTAPRLGGARQGVFTYYLQNPGKIRVTV